MLIEWLRATGYNYHLDISIRQFHWPSLSMDGILIDTWKTHSTYYFQSSKPDIYHSLGKLMMIRMQQLSLHSRFFSICDNNKCSTHCFKAYSMTSPSNPGEKRNTRSLLMRFYKVLVYMTWYKQYWLIDWFCREPIWWQVTYRSCKHWRSQYNPSHHIITTFTTIQTPCFIITFYRDSQEYTCTSCDSTLSSIHFWAWTCTPSRVEFRYFRSRQNDTRHSNWLQHPIIGTMALEPDTTTTWCRLYHWNVTTGSTTIKEWRWNLIIS